MEQVLWKTLRRTPWSSTVKRDDVFKRPVFGAWTSIIDCISATGTNSFLSSCPSAKRSGSDDRNKMPVLSRTGNSLRHRTSGLQTTLPWSASERCSYQESNHLPDRAKIITILWPWKPRDSGICVYIVM